VEQGVGTEKERTGTEDKENRENKEDRQGRKNKKMPVSFAVV
jgi:hypothetical protein